MCCFLIRGFASNLSVELPTVLVNLNVLSLGQRISLFGD